MKIKSLSLVVSLVATLFVTTQAHAVPMLTYDMADITGVTGLNVGGTSWDMTLYDGSFDDLLSVSAVLPIYDSAFALDASTALRDFLIPYIHPVLSASDFVGCTSLYTCHITTVYDYLPSSFIGTSTVWDIDDGVYTGPVAGTPAVDFFQVAFATWTLSEATPAHEPSIAILLGSGLLLVGVARRKARV